MCGITGWIDWKQNLTHQQSTIERMAKTLHHRGPDERKTWVSPNAAFGHARLIVVDPDGGRQPMTKTVNAESYTIVYNGELYNTEDIRNVLKESGYTFGGHSDTEVLLTAYIKWGEDCLERLNGIFAFAIWDEKREKVFMARDRLGVKPLFYSEQNGSLLFASEPKAILNHPDMHAVIDSEGLSEVFGLGPSRTPGHGVFKGIHEIRPAHALHFTKNGVRTWRYWNVQSYDHLDSEEDTVEQVKTLFEDGVRRQLYADVPVATFLSGGVDSSAISAIAAKVFKEDGIWPLNTFSVDYQDNDRFFQANDYQPNSDGPYISKVSQDIGSSHHNLVIDNEQLVDHLKTAIDFRDMPGQADVDASLLWFCQGIKQEATVGLSGECADEILGGYPWFHNPETASDAGFPWIHSITERQQLLNDAWHERLNLRDYTLQRYHESRKETPFRGDETKDEARRRELFYLNMTWFMTALLDRKDRMSMGASLEVRVPFADHRLVEYLWNVPWNMKMMGGYEKGVFRKAMESYLPKDVLYRKKSPYPKTHHPQYTQAVSEWLQSIIQTPSAPILELLDKKQLQDLIDTQGSSFDKPWFGQLMNGPQLIAHLAQINYWLETYNVNIEA
ncbi:asparagine synthase (glutamine-hydrolyzing) [Tuberibacillus sp. Marseille-P3662]|uniref:asparagine synthase (glutamine-hydrolyzing) n=1 Tax=Tuberibacillus sp. Marseille-P3662 TaxID=1965358 RepID=UPI000A1CB1E2|nr:asparagine synthase (glutamine-hydrolyzing) [Tuberibacillus sp. Marseille-P3662]